MTATATAARYTATRIDGRYKVLDSLTGKATTAASKAKAEERAAKLNEADAAETAATECPACGEPAGHGPSEEGDCPLAIHRVPTAPLAVITLDGAEVTVQATPTAAAEEETPAERIARSAELAAAVAADTAPVESKVIAIWSNPAAKAPAAPVRKPAAAKAKPGRKADPTTRGMWIVAKVSPIITASTDPAHASIVAKLNAAVPNGQGGRTIRLTREEAVTLAAIATDIETAVLDESVEVENRGRLAHSCVSMRERATALWA